jgi:hypothetical protein
MIGIISLTPYLRARASLKEFYKCKSQKASISFQMRRKGGYSHIIHLLPHSFIVLPILFSIYIKKEQEPAIEHVIDQRIEANKKMMANKATIRRPVPSNHVGFRGRYVTPLEFIVGNLKRVGSSDRCSKASNSL